jgi:hypothetical protein
VHAHHGRILVESSYAHVTTFTVYLPWSAASLWEAACNAPAGHRSTITGDPSMASHENERLSLQKAINAHDQAASALTDLIGELPQERYVTMLARIEENIAALKEQAERAEPGGLA